MGRTLVLLCGFLLVAMAVQAQIPRTLSYQGMLADSLGVPRADGWYTFNFSLYDELAGGQPLWSETKDLEVKAGLFSTVLGEATPFPASVGFDRQYWLGISVGVSPELSPRMPLSAVGYSMRSLAADTAEYARAATVQAFVDSARVAGGVPDGSVTAATIAPGQIVRSINGLHDDMFFSAAGGATITTSNDTLIINAGSGGGGTGVQAIQNTNSTLTIANPAGPTVTVNVRDMGIASRHLAGGAVTPTHISPTGALNGQSLVFNGSAIAWGTPLPWEMNGPEICYTSGKVGIGLSKPSAKLEVTDLVRIQGPVGGPSWPSSEKGLEIAYAPSLHKGYIQVYDRESATADSLRWGNLYLGNGKVGIGALYPASKLEVAGTIHSTSGGFKFPDGSVQTKAASGDSTRFPVPAFVSPWTLIANNTTQVIVHAIGRDPLNLVVDIQTQGEGGNPSNAFTGANLITYTSITKQEIRVANSSGSNRYVRVRIWSY